MIGHVEARVGPEVSLRHRPEGILDELEAPRVGVQPRQARDSTQEPGRTGAKFPLSARIAGRATFASTTQERARCRSFVRARTVGWASTRAARRSTTASTSAMRARSSCSRCSSASSSTRATTRRSWPTSPTSTTRSTTRAQARGVRSVQLADEMTAAYLADTDGLGLGRPDAEPLASSSIDGIVAYIQDADRPRRRLRGRRRRVLPRALGPVVRLAVAPRRRRHGPGRGRRGRPPQAGPARFRAVEGPEGGRGRGLGRALGPRASRLAHRVLGDGRGGARRGLRDPRRRQRPHVPPPRERGGADARWRATPSSPRSGCTTGCCRWAPRRWRSPSATSRCCTRCSSA